jgi:hypothetical protein
MDYEKCKFCHLFIEENDDHEEDPDLASHLHLSRGDAADALIEETHNATPSGHIATLDWWKINGPTEMQARFE